MRHKGSLAIYTAVHFCVDFVCFYMLFGTIKPAFDDRTLVLAFLIYNLIAFGLQPVIGYISDTFKKFSPAPWGCILLAIGMLVTSLPWASLVLCALGNAVFHVGGGIDGLVYGDGKLARSGIFVSSGAVGVALGTLCAKYTWFGTSVLSGSIPVLMMGVCGLLCIYAVKEIPKEDYTVKSFGVTGKAASTSTVLILCIAAIIVRAYVGAIIPTGWRLTSVFMMAVPAICACAGKIIGGFLSDKLGAPLVGTASLLLSVPFISLLPDMPVFGIIGLIMFNMAMPITLCAVAERLPNNPGLAFGFTTLGLLIGTVPTFLFAVGGTLATLLIAILTIGAALCLRFSLADIRLPGKAKSVDLETENADL